MDKQIEEMAKVYDEATSCARNYLGSMNNAGKWYGNAFYNAGYRKIPEGAVVLKMEDYNRIRSKERKVIDIEVVMKAEEKARKETVDKFAERLLEEAFADFSDDDYDRLCILVDEIAKEIKEGKV